MKTLIQYINESLDNLLMDENNWLKVSSKEYCIYVDDKPELFDMIPYIEFNLKKPDSIIITLKKDGSRWFGIIKWTHQQWIDRNIYVCNGWKAEADDKNELANKMHKIITHLSKSKKARDKFKQLILSYKNDIDKYNSKNDENLIDPKDVIMRYNEKLCIYSLDQLLKF